MYFNARVSKDYEQKINFIKNYYSENLNKEINYRQILEMGIDLLLDKIDDKSNEQQALLESYNDELLRNLVALFDSKFNGLNIKNDNCSSQNYSNNAISLDDFKFIMIDVFRKLECTIQLVSSLIKLKTLSDFEREDILNLNDAYDLKLANFHKNKLPFIVGTMNYANVDSDIEFSKKEKILRDDSTNVNYSPQNYTSNTLSLDDFKYFMIDVFGKLECTIKLVSSLIKLNVLSENESNNMLNLNDEYDSNFQNFYNDKLPFIVSAMNYANVISDMKFQKREELLREKIK